MNHMMKKLVVLLCLALPVGLFAQLNTEKPQVKTANGIVEGVSGSGVSIFKGIPFAQPPVGDLRWKEPQPVKNWEGVRKADQFGPRAMQKPIFSDMNFRSNGVSEDCLYLNVWTPAKSAAEKLPVLVYFYGGGYIAGDGSEYRYDGESMARKGIVTLTVNYRLGVFGFLALPELSQESSYHGSGNYGLMDQWAALKWVQQNIAAFGGDPKRVTIAGESAGSISVSAQMASPLSRDLIAGAIGESGAMINPTLAPVPLIEGEQAGTKFATLAGAKTLAELRAIPADKLLDLASQPNGPRFSATIDGYFLPKLPAEIFVAGEQAHVPLLLGWNSEESNYKGILGDNDPNPDNYAQALNRIFKGKTNEALKCYPGSNPEEIMKSATALAGDRFIAYSTWKWYDMHLRTGNSDVYRYFYSRPRPVMRSQDPASSPANTGAVHSAEIEYALGNLPTNRVYDWQPEDYKVSAIMQEYFANFIKTGNPNGTGLPLWPAANKERPAKIMVIDSNTHAEEEKDRKRYLFLDMMYNPMFR
jgi:para-nitrobenzyl esterase